MVDWELTAEVLSLLSGGALSWPALRLNQCLRRAHQQQTKAKSGRSKYLNELRVSVAQAYTAPYWSPLDHILTIGGVGLIILSSAIRVCMQW